MIQLSPPFRRATRADARAMAELVDMAGEGLPFYLWSRMAKPGEDAWTIGEQRAEREEGSFSWRNTVVAEADGKVAAALIGYLLPETPEPIDYATMTAMFVPLQELENLAPGTWYVNVLAAYPKYRSQGYGTQLLDLADRIAADSGAAGLSIIVSDGNEGARRLYERSGYREVATRPMVKDDWESNGEDWVLLVKRR